MSRDAGLSQRCRRVAQGTCTVRRKTVTDVKTTQLFCTSTEPPAIETGVRKVEGPHGSYVCYRCHLIWLRTVCMDVLYMTTSGTASSGAATCNTHARGHVSCSCNYHKIYLLEPILSKHVLHIIIDLRDLRILWSVFQYVSVKMSICNINTSEIVRVCKSTGRT